MSPPFRLSPRGQALGPGSRARSGCENQQCFHCGLALTTDTLACMNDWMPHLKRRLGWAAVALLMCGLAQGVAAQSEHQAVLDAREALRKGDKARLASAVVATRQNPLAQWVEYWELGNRLDTAQADELEAFYARWPGTYVEDRLRNDWLLELGKRRDWVNFSRDFPRFRMNDDREVTCYALLTQHLKGAGRARGGTRGLVRAARPGRRLQPAGQQPDRCRRLQRQRRLAQGAAGDRGQPPERGARGGRAGQPGGVGCRGGVREEPRALPRAQRGRRCRDDGTGHAGPAATGQQGPRRRGRRAEGALADGAAQTPGRARLGRRGRECSAAAAARSRHLLSAGGGTAPAGAGGQTRTGTLVGRHAGLAGACGIALQWRGHRALGAGDQRSRPDEPRRAEGPHLGVLACARNAGARPRRCRWRSSAPGGQAVAGVDLRADELLRQAGAGRPGRQPWCCRRRRSR